MPYICTMQSCEVEKAELRKEIERLRAEAAHLHHQSNSLGEQILILRAELAECKQDAERYRWLIKNCRDELDDGTVVLKFCCDFDNYNDISAAIDAALRGEGE